MIILFDSKRYNWSLFAGHLMVEKLLKAYFIKTNGDFPPFIHNLLRLAEICKLELDDEKKFILATITAFNINARYDDYKMSFQKTVYLNSQHNGLKTLKQLEYGSKNR